MPRSSRWRRRGRRFGFLDWRSRGSLRSLDRRRRGYLQIIDDLLYSRLGSCITCGSFPLRVVIDRAGKGHHSIFGFHT